MTCQIDIKKKVPWKRRGVQMTDTDMNNLSLYLEKNYGLTSDRVIAKAIDIVANDNSFHPIIDLLESLKWDGRPRIAGMLTHFFGAEDPEYSGEVMKMHMLAAISRLYEPGKKYDIMLCLVGGQGTGKSTFFKYLAIKDEWFTDDVKRLDDKKVYAFGKIVAGASVKDFRKIIDSIYCGYFISNGRLFFENKTIREASIDMIHIPDEVLNAQSCIRLLVCDNRYYSREVEVSYEIFEEWLNKYKGIANKQQTD